MSGGCVWTSVGSQNDLDALRAVGGEAERLGRRGKGPFGCHQFQDVDFSIDDESDRLVELGAETECALQVDLLGHDRIGRHRDLAAREIADLDDVPPRRTLAIAAVRPAAVPEISNATSKALSAASALSSASPPERSIVWSAPSLRGEGERRCGYVGDGDPAAAFEPGREHGEKPDRAGAEQDDALVAISPARATACRLTASGSASAAA